MKSAMERIAAAKEAMLCMQRHSWEQGLAMQACLETGDKEAVIRMAFEAANRMTEDGRCASIGVFDAETDPCAAGRGLLFAASETGDRKLKEAADRLLDWALNRAPRNRDGIVYHLLTGHEFWADSAYMLPPFLAEAGQYQEAEKQLQGYWDALLDPTAGLMAHKWDDDRSTFSDPMLWGVGNGWFLMGLVSTIGIFREHGIASGSLEDKYKRLLEKVTGCQRPDGSLSFDLTDEDSFADMSATSMTAYSIFRGKELGLVAPEQCGAAQKMCIRVEKEQDEYGLIHNACGAPYFDRAGIAPEEQAVFMMMENSRNKIVNRS